MKNKSLRHSIFLNSIAIAVLLTSVNASRMTMVAGNLLHRSRSNAPTIGSCPIFPQNNFWNMPVDNLPVHSLSSAWVTTIGPTTGFHMDFGSGTWDGGPIGIPFNVVSGAQTTKYTVDFYYPGESDPGPYPIPQNPKIEYGSDHHILTIDTDDCKLYEIYDALQSNGQWSAGSGAIWDLNSNALRPDGWTSADAAGLPILAGLVRYDEVAAGRIDHALRFTTDCTADYYIWPARHVAQYGNCTTTRVPFGARFRLKANYDITQFSPQAQIILQAMKTYGIVLADNGSPWYVSGEPNESWDNDVLHELDVVTGNNFEAVDTSQLTPWIFSDVPGSHWAWQYIERLYNAGITGGCSTLPTLKYCPSVPVTRAQMAIFLVRAMHGVTFVPPTVTGVFADVPVGSFGAAFIEQLAADGITSGCGGNNFCPNSPVTRSSMAIFLVRAKHGVAFVPPTATGIFSDAPVGSFGADFIEQLVADSITSGCGANNYCPNSTVTRDQMAVFLVRTFSLP